MSYNHRSAEKAWLKWKEAEEKELRRLGMAEDAIQQLHTYDWQQFNRERQYLQRWTENVNAMNEQRIEAPTFFCYTVDRMLDEIDNYQLYEALSSEDPLTLKMVLMRIEGYTGKMIGQVMGVSEQLVNNRISRFRKKYKKFLKA